jgi:hypothetical protein
MEVINYNLLMAWEDLILENANRDLILDEVAGHYTA